MTTAKPHAGEPRTRHFGAGHLVPLDGLRGFAILAVMASHLFEVNYAGQGPAIRALGQVFYYGWMGVDLFFVLSGFLITGILIDSREGPGYFKNFYARRVLRIFPLYYGLLFLLLLLTVPLRIQWRGIFIPLLLYLQNLEIYNRFTYTLGPNISLNHLWSLAIEEQFYLVWPLLVFLARTRRRILWLSLALALTALLFRVLLLYVWVTPYAAHHNMFARADSLLLGGILAVLYRSPAAWRRAQSVSPWLCAVTTTAVVGSLLYGASNFYWLYAIRFSVVALASGALLVWSLTPGPLSSVFSVRLLRWFGKYSYGLYVLHVTFLPWLSRTGRDALYRLYPSKAFAVGGTALLVLALSSLAAWLSFQLYEKRFLRLKRYFDYTTPNTLPRQSATAVPHR